MNRALLVASLAFSGAVHAALVPEHLHEMPLLGAAFIPAAAASFALAFALIVRPDSRALPLAAAMLLASELVVYIGVIALHIEGVETIAVFCKLVEAGGIVVAVPRTQRGGRTRAAVAAIIGSAAGVYATAALAAPPAMPMPSLVAAQTVAIPGRSYDPPAQIAVVGQAIIWTNFDSTSHTVTADDGSFDSGPIPPGGSFTWAPSRVGTYAYHCSIHHFMRGRIDVYELALRGPQHAAAAGSTVTLHGVAQLPGTQVTLANQTTGTTAATTTSAADGAFAFTVTADTPATYHASTGTATSPAYTLAVAARPTLTLIDHQKHTYRFEVTANPAQPAALIALQQYIPELFAWRVTQRRRLDASSHTAFAQKARPGIHVRLVILAGVNGYHGGTSKELRLP